MYPAGPMIWMGFGWLLTLAVGAGIVWFLLTISSTGLRKKESPEEILRRRLANGEIDVAEYGQRLIELSKHKPAA